MVRTLENNYSICQKQQINSPGKKIAAYLPYYECERGIKRTCSLWERRIISGVYYNYCFQVHSVVFPLQSQHIAEYPVAVLVAASSLLILYLSRAANAKIT